MNKRIPAFLLLFIALCLSMLVVNTLRFTSKQTDTKALPAPALTTTSVQNLQKAIRYKTVSFQNVAQMDSCEFIGFQQFLKAAYPLVHRNLSLERVNRYSLLFRWKGKNSALKPVILMAHLDVVPVEEASRSLWKVDPFAGVIKDGYIWGRGTVDNKANLIAILETVEKLLQYQFQPDRTIYLVFGHDEEVGGPNGARKIAQLLQARNVQAEFVLDEGGFVTQEKIPGMRQPVALLGTAEKGFLTLTLSVEKPGGHASMPEHETAVDIITQAIGKIRREPFEADLTPSQDFVEHLGPEMPFFQKLAFANAWLLKDVIIRTYEKTPTGNALVRTTVVPTILTAGMKENVVPTVATATLNLRLLPGDSIRHVTQRIRAIVDDERVRIKVSTGTEASEITAVDSFGYRQVERAVKRTFPGTITTPFLLIGGTDSKHFQPIATSIIRFSPMTEPIGFHGVNERLSLDGFRHALWFYEQLIREL